MTSSTSEWVLEKASGKLRAQFPILGHTPDHLRDQGQGITALGLRAIPRRIRGYAGIFGHFFLALRLAFTT